MIGRTDRGLSANVAGCTTAAGPYDPVAEQDEARRARADRDRRLTSSERLQRLHDLCAQLATMTPAQRRDRP